ncbi:swr complex subunit [Coniochaeta pulveracea]|uniref:SWR1-complex protein 4 n=1 Tax=Coniochaeta pulveracea TaxID=177199 RepID=A0A420YP85_9PEZI|nr:swr complex subunit [Coniochaeta pulveracea]
MTSADVREVLNLNQPSGPRPKKQKVAAPRQSLKGLAREVQALGGDNPIAIVPEITSFRKKRFGSRKPAARWELRPFQNSARGDNGALVLRHWRQKKDAMAPPGDDLMDGVQMETDGKLGDGENKKEVLEDSSFAKYNVKIPVPQYDDDQYNNNLQNDDWSKEETDYLMETVRDFDLRWPLIWDRYEFVPEIPDGPDGGEALSVAVMPAPKPRTMEDLKQRYYEVAAKMMAVQKPAQYMTRPEFELYETMLQFNAAKETQRKRFVANTLARTREEAREEESLLMELKRILARNQTFNEERRDLYRRLDFPPTNAEEDLNAYKSSAGLANLLQNLMNSEKSKKRKSLAAGPDGPGPTPTSVSHPGPSGVHQSSEGPGHRRESIAASTHGGHGHHRDSITSATPATPAEPTPAPGGADKKKKGGATAAERRKLTEQEEQVYGVTYGDRLGGGPTFRYEKINKLYSHKSNQQQKRITNLLTELDIPPRLAMPTAKVVEEFERLWGALTALVDLRKVNEKLDNEIMVEEVKKAERDRAKGIVPAEEEQEKAADDGQNGETGEAGAEGDPPSVVIKNEEGDQVPEQTGEVNGEKEKRPSSSGGHKRSASVLSAGSDKSNKRQKK